MENLEIPSKPQLFRAASFVYLVHDKPLLFS